MNRTFPKKPLSEWRQWIALHLMGVLGDGFEVGVETFPDFMRLDRTQLSSLTQFLAHLLQDRKGLRALEKSGRRHSRCMTRDGNRHKWTALRDGDHIRLEFREKIGKFWL